MARGNGLGQAFIAHTVEMRRSIAWRFLPDNARRLIDRIELEHMEHGGSENGRLVITYDDFERAGLRRKSVPLAIRQAVALGFLEVTMQGGRAAGKARAPSTYRLTYIVGTKRSAQRTDDWKRIKAPEEAARRLRLADAPLPRL